MTDFTKITEALLKLSQTSVDGTAAWAATHDLPPNEKAFLEALQAYVNNEIEVAFFNRTGSYDA